MSKSREINEFGEIKSVLAYLEQVKKGIHNKSLSEQIEFKKEIKKRHDKKQIQLFIGRLEDQFEIRKTIGYLITALFAISSLVIGSTINFALNNLEKLGWSFDMAPLAILLLFLTALLGWCLLSNEEFGRLRKISSYKRLLQECLDEMPEKRYFRRRV